MISFALLILVILFGAFIRNKKISAGILAFYMWLLLAFSYGNSDYASYENQFRYYNVVNRNWSISNFGYKALCRLFYPMGVDYATFLIIEASIIIILYYIFVVRNCKNPYLCLLLVCIYPFIIDTTQVRTFFAAALMITALSIYADGKGLRSYIGMLIFLMLAFSIHFSFAAFLVFLMMPLMQRKYISAWAIIVAFIEVILFSNIGRIALLITSQSQIDRYFGKGVSGLTVLFLIIYFIALYFPVIVTGKHLDDWLEEGSREKRFAEIVIKANILMLIFVPYCFITNDFMRYFRSIFVLNYAMLINSYSMQKATIDHKLSLRRVPISQFLLVVEMAFALFSNYFYVLRLYWDTVVLPLFQNNVLIP
jgi:hypothetical protein